MLIAFAVLAPETVAINFFIVILIGVAFGYLNLGWIAAALLRERVPPAATVRYHVGL
jgi:hypothetical protein